MRSITETLSIGSATDGRVRGGEFTRVVSLSSPTEATTHEHTITDGEHDYDEFASAVQAIGDGLDSGESVLVHCNAGLSRSVSATIAALVVYEDWEYDDAYEACRSGFIHPAPELKESIHRFIDENQGQ